MCFLTDVAFLLSLGEKALLLSFLEEESVNSITGYGGAPSQAEHARPTSPVALRRLDHRFYTTMSIAIAITVFIGFAETFYLKSYFHKPALHRVAEIHGLLNTCWIILFVVQNALIVSGRVDLHRGLGWVGAALSLLLVPFGIATGIDSVRQGHMVNAPDIYTALLTFTFRNNLIFAILMAAAISWRRNSEVHKRLALLAAIALFAEPSVGRIPRLSFPLIVVVILAFFFAGPIYDLFTRGRVHTVYQWAVPSMLILGPLTPLMTIAARTSVWHNFTDRLIR